MKTILQALIDEIDYPFPQGKFENKLLARGLDGEDVLTYEVLTSSQFKGAVADCLYSLIEAINFSEADKSVSITYKDLILKKMNALYASIGEPEKCFGEPMVYIGG